MHEQPGLSDTHYSHFQSMVYTRSGLVFDGGRRGDLERAVLRIVAELALPDPQAFLLLLGDPTRGAALLDRLISDLTVGETYFFRHPAQWQALEHHILPELVARHRGNRRLRIWSAGCATGEEAYSLAILLDRVLPDLAEWNVKIIGTDINRRALDVARGGTYGAWSFRRVPATLKAAYFTQAEHGYSVLPRIRRLVSFNYLNLVEEAYPSLSTNSYAVDLIFCRNVLIYFDTATSKQVVDKLWASLDGNGWLMVGHAESWPPMFRQFTTRMFPGTVAYTKAADVPAQHSYSVAQLKQPSPGSTATPLKQLAPGATLAPAKQFSPAASAVKTAPAYTAKPASAERPPSYDMALAAWEDGRAAEALQQLAALARTEPRNAKAPYLAAKICADSSKLDDAERWIEQAIQRAPLLPEAHYLHGIIYAERGEFEAASTALRRCLFADPRLVLGHWAVADVYARLGQWGRAHKALNNVLLLLAPMGDSDAVAQGDGITAGQLRELVTRQQDQWYSAPKH